jgi:hypothetical protein
MKINHELRIPLLIYLQISGCATDSEELNDGQLLLRSKQSILGKRSFKI